MTDCGPMTVRSRTWAWSPTIASSPRTEPAYTTAFAHTVTRTPIRSGVRFSCCVADVRASRGTFPSTAFISTTDASPIRVPSSTTTFGPNSTPSPRWTSSPMQSARALFAGRSIPLPPRRFLCADARDARAPCLVQRLLQPLEHAHDAQAALAVRQRPAALAHARDEVLALQPQRLVVRHPRRPDVARARDVLAVGVGLLVEALVVDGDLALRVHVVERRHALRAHDREAALLVRVEPRQVQVGGDARREAHEREDDVLDALAHVGLAAGVELVGLLVGEMEEHRDVVRAEAPQRVLLRAQLAQVQPVAVDVVDVAELARVGDLLEPVHAGVVLEQVADHEDPARRARRLARPLGVGDRLGERLLDEAVLARLEDAHGELGMRRDRRGEDGRVARRVGEQVVEVAGEPRAGVARGEPRADVRVAVAAPAQVGAGQRVEVAREVRAPVAEPDDAEAHLPVGHSRTAARVPWRVMPRRSRTCGARSTIASWSTSGWAVTITARSVPSSASSNVTLRRSNSTSSGTCGSW